MPLLVICAALAPPARPRAGQPPAKPAAAVSPAAKLADPALAADPLYAEFLKVNYVFNRELYALCIARYEKILAGGPTPALTPLVHYALGLCHYHLLAASVGEGARTPQGSPTRVSRKPGGKEAQTHARQALLHLKEAIRDRRFPARTEATLALGQVFLLEGDFSKAAVAFQWVAGRHPAPDDAAAALLGLADARYSSGKYETAATAYRKFLDAPLEADRERAEFYLGMSLYRQSESQSSSAPQASRTAAALFRKIADRDGSPFGADSLYMLALLRQQEGGGEEAIASFEKLAASSREDRAELGLFGLAGALSRAGRHADAAARFKRFLELYPDSPRREVAALSLARSLAASGDSDAAVRLLRGLTSSPATGVDAALELARIYSSRSDPQSAARTIQSALAMHSDSPRRPELEVELVTEWIDAGRFDAAGAKIDQLASTRKEISDRLAYLRAYALHRSARHEEAVAVCDAFPKEHPGSPLARNMAQIRAESLFLDGKYESARKAYTGYLERFASDLVPRDRLHAGFRAAEALYLMGDNAGARRELLALKRSVSGDAAAALREDKALATFEFVLGQCAYQLKDYPQAQRSLRAFVARATTGRRPDDPPLDKQLEDARFCLAHSLQLAGKVAEAEAAYRESLQADPKGVHRVQATFELGQLAFARKDYGAARQAFEATIREGADSRFAPHALRFLAWLDYREGKYDKAAEFYGKLVQSFPDHPLAVDAEFEMAMSLEAAGRSAEAATALKRFAARHPSDPRLAEVRLREAQSLSRQGDRQGALKILTALEASPDAAQLLPRVLYEQAWCHRGEKDLEAATRVYRRILALEDAGELGATARLELAELTFDAGNHAGSLKLLEPLTRAEASGEISDATRSAALYRACWCHFLLGENDETVAISERFRKEHPGDSRAAEIALLAGRALAARGEPRKAREIFRTLAAGPPDRPETHAAAVSYGESLNTERKFREAKAHFEAFLKKHPDSPQAQRARFALAWARENLSELNEAIAIYREVVRAASNAIAARAQFQIGQCLAAQKKYSDAIVEFLQVPASFPYKEWNARAILQAAGCFELLGDRAHARKYYQEVIATHPDRDEARLARTRMAKLQRN